MLRRRQATARMTTKTTSWRVGRGLRRVSLAWLPQKKPRLCVWARGTSSSRKRSSTPGAAPRGSALARLAILAGLSYATTATTASPPIPTQRWPHPMLGRLPNTQGRSLTLSAPSTSWTTKVGKESLGWSSSTTRRYAYNVAEFAASADSYFRVCMSHTVWKTRIPNLDAESFNLYVV